MSELNEKVLCGRMKEVKKERFGKKINKWDSIDDQKGKKTRNIDNMYALCLR